MSIKKWEEGYDSESSMGPFIDAVANQSECIDGEDVLIPDIILVREPAHNTKSMPNTL